MRRCFCHFAAVTVDYAALRAFFFCRHHYAALLPYLLICRHYAFACCFAYVSLLLPFAIFFVVSRWLMPAILLPFTPPLRHYIDYFHACRFLRHYCLPPPLPLMVLMFHIAALMFIDAAIRHYAIIAIEDIITPTPCFTLISPSRAPLRCFSPFIFL